MAGDPEGSTPAPPSSLPRAIDEHVKLDSDRRPATVVYPSVGGEMDALLRTKEWSDTRLGPRATWPQSLRTALSIVMSSRFPMIIFWGPDLCVLYNDAYIPIFANKHPDVLGKTGFEAWGEVWDVIGPMFEAVTRRGETTWSKDQLLILRRKGFDEETYLTWSYSPITDETGGVGGVFTSVIETTETVLAERRLKTLRELGENVSTAKGKRDACEVAARILRKTPGDLPFALLYLLDGARAHLVATCGLEDHPAAPQEIGLDESPLWPLRAVQQSGQLEIVRGLRSQIASLPGGPWPEAADAAVVLPIPSADPDQPFGFVVAGASPRLELDEQYLSFFSLLANHVGSTVANADAYEQERRRAEALAKLDQAKTTFFSNVSHEFRTPLTLMLGPLEDALGTESALSGASLETAYRNALRLLKLVNALLDFSRIEVGRMQASFEPTDLCAATVELASAFQSAVENAGLRFLVRCAPLAEPVYVDREMWEKVVLNLLSNAFKFTFDGEIEVGLEQLGDRVLFSVRDTGTGVPEQELPRLFERFHRVAGSRARTHEGSGIGLALVQELVRMHGGEVGVESELGHGTTFRVSLPFGSDHLPKDRISAGRNLTSTATSSAAYVEEARRWLPTPKPHLAREVGLDRSSEPPRETDGARILLADDNADMREYVARLLRERWAVETVPDGEAALDALRRNKFDLVLTDVMMPRLDGFGLLREIKSAPDLNTIPVVMLSARAGEESRIEGLQAGADDYLAKPFSARELLARVSNNLQLARARQQSAVLLAAAEAANRAKDEFLALLGHELRNPLSPILTALQVLRLRGVQGGERERAIIERQVHHLVRLIDDLLDVSRITRGRIELKKARVEIAEVVANAVEASSPLLDQKHHYLIVEVPRSGLAVIGDPVRLAQVLSNLIINAAKYTDREGRITVQARRAGGEVVINVIDTGVGIAPDLLMKVFEIFIQETQPIDRSLGGLGLGLAIVRSLVHLHGGSVTAESDGPGRGSTFTVRLPLAPDQSSSAATGASAVGSTPIPAARRACVLIVDDNEDSAEMVALSLDALGYRVRTAHDGPSALQIVESFTPAVALLDIGLPSMDGYELARRLKEHPRLQAIHLVAVTGYGQDSDRDRAQAAGFHAHLVKPVDLGLLEKVVGELAGDQRLATEQ